MKFPEKGSSIRLFLVVLLFLGLLFGSFILSICVGAKEIGFSELLDSFFSYDANNTKHIIVQTLRVPRAMVAAAVGCSLAVSGCLMQAATRNPMASPSVLGINAGAGLGLAVAMVFLPSATFNETVLFSFAGASVAAFLIFGVASVFRAGSSPVRLALVGTAITALFNAFSQALAVYFNISQELTFWNAGGVSGVRPDQARMLIPWTGAGLLLALLMARPVSLLSLGEDVATGLGGNVRYIKFMSSLAVLILTGSAVAIAGPISFVGLVVPHGVKAVVGANYKTVIPVSIIAGALLVVLADILSRLINPPFETPTGAITALVGVPFFVYLAKRKGSRV